MGLSRYILEAIARARGLQCKSFDVAAAIAVGTRVFYWHSFNGVDYIRYELLASVTESNICITSNPEKIPSKGHNKLSVHTPSQFHFVEADGLIYVSNLVISSDAVLYIGDESPARVRIYFTAEKIDE